MENLTREQIAIKIIKKYEGLSLEPYICPAGVLTIGYGHTGVFAKAGVEIDIDQAEAILMSDLSVFVNAVDGLVKVKLSENQYGALISLVYNIGIKAFTNSTMLRRLNASDPLVSDEFTRWVYSKGKKLQGLIKRRLEEKAIFDQKEIA